ncbi:phage tail protein [Acinetobacter junii]|uniref:phage tail protein n=1 Tax=Acinetobacter junii TaxID=40215 RepID=UPI0028618574|nr:phage tail protein [Acinetobacter junii]MDR7655036.1 phage tail protein [Acinetobacter junii]
MAEQIYYSVFTKQGLALLTEAIQNGTKLGITSMAFGDGGGSLPVPNENFTSMVREVHRTQLNSLAPDPNNANWLRAEAIIASAVGGFNIRELGLYAGNVLVAYSNYPATYKPNPSDGTARIMTFRMILQIDNTANFDLVIDPDVVLATIQFVNNQFNQTVQTVEKIEKLIELEKWQGRTVDTKDAGLFYCNNDEWVPSPLNNSVLITQKFAMLGGFAKSLESALAYANSNQIGTLIVAQGNYTLDRTVIYKLTSAIRIVFMPNTIINNYIAKTAFQIDINQKHLEVIGNAAQFPLHANSTEEISVFELNDYTLNKSCTIDGIRTGDSNSYRYSYGIKGSGLNLPIFSSNVLNCKTGVHLESLDVEDATYTHAMGAQFRNNIIYSETAIHIVNKGALTCEGWTVSGGEIIADTAFIVEDQAINNMYSIVGRISDIHVNAKRFCYFEALNRVKISNVDFQAKITTDNTYKAMFEFCGCQGVQTDGLSISRVFSSDATIEHQLPVFGLLTPKDARMNAHIIVDEMICWLATASKELIFIESQAAAASVYLNSFAGGPYQNRLITAGYEQYLNASQDILKTELFTTYGYCISTSATFDETTGTLTLGNKPRFGNFYHIASSIVPSGSFIKKINSFNVQGQNYTLFFEANNLSINHNADLLCPLNLSIYFENSANSIICESINKERTRIISTSYNVSEVQNRTVSTTASALNSITNAINTKNKYLGKEVFNSTTSQFMKAVGSNASDNWISLNGSSTITPT